jgi:hypothetical protein
MQVHALSSTIFEAYETLRKELQDQTQAVQPRAQLGEGKAPPGWIDVDGIMMYQSRAFLSDESSLWPMVLDHAHTMGHEGSEKTLHRLWATF